MSAIKRYDATTDVLEAARARIATVFDTFEKVYVSFSGGKDSTVMLHLVMDEAIARGRKVGVLVIDLEAQYALTMAHVENVLDMYKAHSEVFWVCLPMLLRNAVTQYEPRWCCWDPEARSAWVRELPQHAGVKASVDDFDFFEPRMEFEEFMVLFGIWYGGGSDTAAFVGIRCDESLNRFRTIASRTKETFSGLQYTTKVEGSLYNVYPIYDWRTEDIWRYHARFPTKPHNHLYDMMHLAGLGIHQMRICQPYGDDQRRGLWLYHIIEPHSWARVVARVNGANQGALYINETGNVTGYNAISKPPGHTYQTFCNLLLESLPASTRKHYLEKFSAFIAAWARRGYVDGIPDEAPRVLENKHWAPSWRRLCKVLLRNDWWCKGLGLTQPKSAAYGKYLDIKRAKRAGLSQSDGPAARDGDTR